MSRASDLAAAVRDALTVPDPAPDNEAAQLAYLVLYARRALHVRTVLGPLTRRTAAYQDVVGLVRQAAEVHPVDYPISSKSESETTL